MTSTVAMQPLLEVLLRKEQRLAIGVGGQLRRRQRLPIRQRSDRRVLRASGRREIVHQLRVERARLAGERVVLAPRR